MVLVLAFLVQDADVAPWIERLGAESIAEREEAMERLRMLGERAVPALLKARESGDEEIRLRANLLLRQHDRTVEQARLEKEQRPRKLSLVKLDFRDAPIADVLKELRRQTSLALALPSNAPDLTARITIQGTEMPLIEALSRIGFEPNGDPEGALRNLRPGDYAYAPGIRFGFSVRPWNPEGKTLGYVVETGALKENVEKARFLQASESVWKEYGPDGYEWDIFEIRAGEETLTLERCGTHSPSLVFIPDPDAQEIQVRIRLLRRWYCDIPMKFSRVGEDLKWKSGIYDVALRWPEVVITTDAPALTSSMVRTLTALEIEIEGTRNPRKILDSIGVGGGGGGRFGGRIGGRRDLSSRPTWCGCRSSPQEMIKTDPDTTRDRVVRIPEADLYDWDDVLSVSLTFHKPIEETFIVVSPILRR